MKVQENLIGKKFGKLTVIARGENTKGGKRKWICKCDCEKNKSKAVTTNDLKTLKVQSCGCKYHESNKNNSATHHKTNTRIYRIWCSMKRRCNPNNKYQCENYSNRDISVCDEWLHDFQAFYDWSIANGYAENLTLDRKDNDKGYSPDNCRWATYKEQENNRRNNAKITIHNETHTASEWEEITGIKAATLLWRSRHNWSESDMFIAPNYGNSRRKI